MQETSEIVRATLHNSGLEKKISRNLIKNPRVRITNRRRQPLGLVVTLVVVWREVASPIPTLLNGFFCA